MASSARWSVAGLARRRAGGIGLQRPRMLGAQGRDHTAPARFEGAVDFALRRFDATATRLYRGIGDEAASAIAALGFELRAYQVEIVGAEVHARVCGVIGDQCDRLAHS